MADTAPSKKGTALNIGLTAIVAIAMKDSITTEHLICAAIIAVLVTVYIVGQIVLEWKKP